MPRVGRKTDKKRVEVRERWGVGMDKRRAGMKRAEKTKTQQWY